MVARLEVVPGSAIVVAGETPTFTAFGVRPEHITLSDAASYRAEILATEYLGTTQILTIETPNGPLKARIASDQPARAGETVGLSFAGNTVTLFDTGTGHALKSDLNAGVLHG